MYKLLLNSTTILRTTDGASIPADPANSDYSAYLKWVAAGNTPTPADPAPAKTSEQATLEGVNYLNSLGWDQLTIISAISHFPTMDATHQGYFIATRDVMDSMRSFAKTTPATFSTSSFTIPHLPSDFGLV